MSKEKLVGTWKYRSSALIHDDGNTMNLFGDDAIGYLVYTADGFMSAQLMTPGRAAFSLPNMREGTEAEKVTAFDTYGGYSGTYEVQGDTVIHHVQVCLFPNWVGKDQVRKFKLEENRLVLSTDAGYAEWERVG